MKLVEQGKLDLDKPLQQYLPKPIYEYKHQKRWHDDFSSLKGDTLYTKITARMCLDHTTGFANWRWDMADQKLRVLQIPLIHSFLLLNRIIVWDTMKRAGFTRKIKIMKHDRQVHSKLL
ncbi:serine hydrolase [Pedobacter cryoconitis]|uniref:serine hydrolase n=1 Tax=Pedobacter cryoconitis TaxID=188932 RepID=UPI001C850B25